MANVRHEWATYRAPTWLTLIAGWDISLELWLDMKWPKMPPHLSVWSQSNGVISKGWQKYYFNLGHIIGGKFLRGAGIKSQDPSRLCLYCLCNWVYCHYITINSLNERYFSHKYLWISNSSGLDYPGPLLFVSVSFFFLCNYKINLNNIQF